MEVHFRTRRLQRCFEQTNEAVRTWGPEIGRRYVTRVDALRKAERVAGLYEIRALDFHPLTGDRRGLHAIRLSGQWRLIISVRSDREVMVEEVVDYHG